METLAELPFIGDQVVCLSHDQAARSEPAERGAVEGGHQAARAGRYARRTRPQLQCKPGDDFTAHSVTMSARVRFRDSPLRSTIRRTTRAATARVAILYTLETRWD